MPTTKTYVAKPEPAEPYRVDNRVTCGQPITPISADIVDGPTVGAVSGVRVNADVSGY